MGRPIHHRSWDGFRSQLTPGGDRRSVTVTFNYGGTLRTLVAPSRKAAFAEASRLWGWGWDGEPCVSNADTIYNDLIGWTKAQHGQDLNVKLKDASDRDRFRRTGQSYA